MIDILSIAAGISGAAYLLILTGVTALTPRRRRRGLFAEQMILMMFVAWPIALWHWLGAWFGFVPLLTVFATWAGVFVLIAHDEDRRAPRDAELEDANEDF